MRLFLYYAAHTLKNQIRKLMKTWVLIFILACMLIGGLLGAGAAGLENMAEQREETAREDMAGEIPPEEEIPLPEEFSLPESTGLEKRDIIELIAGAGILGILVWQCLSADTNGSKIFLPADVNLLFSSPMTPQGVLMFRLTTKLGTFVFVGLYLLFQLPNLVLNVGMSLWAALALIAVFCLTIMTGSLMQVLLYTMSSTRPGMKDTVRRVIYGLLGAALLAWGVYWKRSGLSPAKAAVGFFNAPASRLFPFWGWLKGFFLFADEGDPAGLLGCLAAVVLGGAALLWAIRRTKADFYEDAMAKSEETAELMERARAEQAKGGLAFRKRKKDRSDSLRRDGMRHGRGASVFFFKTLYNRFRFAHLGIFTKTMETYLAAGLGVAAVCRFMFHTSSTAVPALALTGLAFFRSLGNPLEQDTKMDFFRLIPESTGAKLFYSLLGGAANCLLDALPALLGAALLLGDGVLSALAWLPLIVSVDFYATSVGTFINLSVPVSGGVTVKQIVQVMFVYFGLIPDVAIMAVGMVMEHTAAAAVISAGVNVFFGLLFFALTPMFLEPGSRPSGHVSAGGEMTREELRKARGVFSRLGFFTVLVLLVGSALQVVVSRLVPDAFRSASWFSWAVTFAPLYLAAFPLSLGLMRTVPAAPKRGEPLGFCRFARLIPISVFLMYVGNFMGIGVNWLINLLPGTGAGNPVASFAMDDALAPKLLCMVVLAPLFEELFFRRCLIDRMRPYGEGLAVLTSAVMFGLFHGNFAQFFYAAALGAVFGYVYLKTGRLRYSLGLHMLINFIGSVLGPALLSRMEAEAEVGTWTMAFYGYGAVLALTAVAGLALLIPRSREIVFDRAPMELPRGKRFSTVWLNIGMLAMAVGSLILFVIAIWGT